MSGGALKSDALFELASAGEWSRRALVAFLGKTAAKELQLSLTDGAPLAICIGRRRVHRFRLAHGEEVSLPVRGCGRIFQDRRDATGGRAYWLRWCPDHPPNMRRQARKVQQDHVRLIKQMRAQVRAERAERFFQARRREA